MKVKLSNLGIKTLRECFSRPRSWFVVAVTALVIFVISALIQNWSFVQEVLFRPGTLFYGMYSALWSQLWNASELMGAFGFWTLWLLAVLFGANLALVGYLRRRSKKEEISVPKKGILGTIVGILGIGCLACNVSLLGTALASIGGIGLISILPLKGRELLLLGLLLGFYSLFSLAKTAEQKTCPIPVPINKN
jgi:hypothetical protein